MIVTQTQSGLTEHLRQIGLCPGDAVVVHSSLRSIGRVHGGASTVIAALCNVVGASGLIVAPTFTYDSERFDPATDPGLTGAISEAVRLTPGAIRSWHPTHSVAAIGGAAPELCDAHHLGAAFGSQSPLARLAQSDGWVLLIGVGHTSNSTVHVGEIVADAPYLDVPFFADSPKTATVLTGRAELNVTLVQPPGCSRAFGAVERLLRQRGAIRDALLGNALTQLVRGQAVVDATIDLLREDQTALLCSDPLCYRCTHARIAIQEANKQ